MTPEGAILNKCKEMLKRLEFMGWVTHWDRLNVGLHMNMQGYLNKHGRVGSPDLLVFVPVDEIMYTMFFEVKREDGTGKQSLEQQEFENKFLGFHNVKYEIITDHKQIKLTIENARRKSINYGKIEDWELPKDLM